MLGKFTQPILDAFVPSVLGEYPLEILAGHRLLVFSHVSARPLGERQMPYVPVSRLCFQGFLNGRAGGLVQQATRQCSRYKVAG